MLEVQKFLCENSIEELKNKFGIKVNHYPDDKLLMLNYGIESPKSHPITIECRSLILHDTTYDIISRKFDRFFNYGENVEYYSDFSWHNCHIMSKEDGSLVGVYYNPTTNRCEISTRSQAKAEQTSELGNWRELILRAFGFYHENEFQEYFEKILHVGKTFIFEFVSPENRIVTKYNKAEMVLLGVNFTTIEHNRDYLENTAKYLSKTLNVRLPKFYDLPKDPNQLIEAANNLPDLNEGFVLWDSFSQKRIKIKSKAYLVAHAIRGENTKPTRKNILGLLFEDNADEFLTYFPEYTDLVVGIRDEVTEFSARLLNIWNTIKHIEDQKTFALSIQGNKFAGLFFLARKHNTDPVVVFNSLPVEKKLRYLEN